MIAYSNPNNNSDDNLLLRYRMERERLIEEITQRVVARLSVSGSFEKNIEKAIDKAVENIFHQN